MPRTSPKLPVTFVVPVFPKVHPNFRKFVLYTKVIYWLNCPLFDPNSMWMTIAQNQWMGTIVLLHHVDNGILIQFWAKGMVARFPIISIIIKTNTISISITFPVWVAPHFTVIAIAACLLCWHQCKLKAYSTDYMPHNWCNVQNLKWVGYLSKGWRLRWVCKLIYWRRLLNYGCRRLVIR